MRLLMLGATGLVGRTILSQALAKDAISEVVAPTRSPLVPQNKLTNPVNLRLDELAPRVKSWDVDAIICALGTTKAKAGSQEAFRYVDYTLPLVFAKAAHGAGVETFALVSAIGAATNSMSFYARPGPKEKWRETFSKSASAPLRSADQALSLAREAKRGLPRVPFWLSRERWHPFCRKSFMSIRLLSSRHPCSIQFSQRDPVAVGSLPKS